MTNDEIPNEEAMTNDEVPNDEREYYFVIRD